jgi:O-antigen/teichoic acid export membrane protein
LSTLAAVPLILGALGTELYGVWVVAGALVLAQGLLDLGVGAALVRFVALEAARACGTAVATVIRRAVAFYAVLSALVVVPLFTLAGDVAALLSIVDDDQLPDAAALIRYAAVSFALTNLSLVLVAALQGLDHVDASFRAQTVGWVLYLPALATGLALGGGVAAVGVAWLVVYVAQLPLLWRALRGPLKTLPPGGMSPPTVRDMLAVGVRWQVSSWADFATFQLPRILGGLALTSSALVTLDLALRFAQAIVAPVFAALPLVIPRAAQAWSRGGTAGLRQLLLRWGPPAMILVAMLAAVALPVGAPAIAVWTGRPATLVDPLLPALIVLGICAHASTGFFSSVLLARGNLGLVVAYKNLQLLLAVSLLAAAVALGGDELAFAAALSTALALPAVTFNRRSARLLSVNALVRLPILARAMLIGFAPPALVVALAWERLTPSVVLLMALPVAFASAVAGCYSCGMRVGPSRTLRMEPRPSGARAL